MNLWEGHFTCFVCQLVIGAMRHLNLHKEVLRWGAMKHASPDRNAVNCLLSWEMHLRFGWVLTFAVNKSVHVVLLTSKAAHSVSGLSETWGVQVWMKGKRGVCASCLCLHSWLGTASLLVVHLPILTTRCYTIWRAIRMKNEPVSGMCFFKSSQAHLIWLMSKARC